MNIITRPILRWPGQLLDENDRRPHPFDSGWTATRRLLLDEADKLGADEVVLQMGIREQDLRIDGEPRANARPPAHPGVIITVEGDQGPLSFPCDTFTERGYRSQLLGWQANVRAVALAMEALRKVDRYGITRQGEQYVGWKQLGSGSPIAAGSGEEPMDVEQAARVLLDAASLPTDPVRVAEVVGNLNSYRKSVARLAMAATHPDRHGGDDQAFKLVERAKRTLEAT